MPAQELERDYSTSSRSADIAGLQTLDNAIFFSRRNEIKPVKEIELAENLQIDSQLQKAGWRSDAEAKRFVYDINLYVSEGLTIKEAVALSTEVFEDHLRYYDAEFIQQEPVLLHSNRFGIWNGERRLLGNNGRPVVDGVDSQERMGSVKRVSEKIEKDLVGLKNNSFMVLMSPRGVSGYLDENGCDIPHLNTLTMVFWKDEHGNIKGLTLVTDLRIDQAEKVMEALGAPANFLAKKGTEMQRVVNVLENPAKPSLPQEYQNPFKYVFGTILTVRGEGDIQLRQKDGKVEIKPVSGVWQKINNFQSLLERSMAKEKCISEFREFILDRFQKVGDPNFQQAVVTMAEEIAVSFGRDVYIKKAEKDNQFISYQVTLPRYTEEAGNITVLRMPDNDFRHGVIALMQNRAGCPYAVRALSGISLGSTISSEGVVSFSVEAGKKGKTCISCGEVNYCTKTCYKCDGMLI